MRNGLLPLPDYSSRSFCPLFEAMTEPTESTPLISNTKAYEAGCLACACLDKSSATPAPTKEKRIIVPSKVEPKTLLANERTFLHWLSVSVLLGMLALTVLRLPTSQGVTQCCAQAHVSASVQCR